MYSAGFQCAVGRVAPGQWKCAQHALWWAELRLRSDRQSLRKEPVGERGAAELRTWPSDLRDRSAWLHLPNDQPSVGLNRDRPVATPQPAS